MLTGIVFLDEVDKLASNAWSQRDISGREVQSCFLKMVEGCLVRLKANRGTFDTGDVLFVASGAFVALDELIKQRKTTEVSK